MGHEFHIEVTELHMFAGHRWMDFGPPCPHDVPHNSLKTIGWGPTVATYELVEAECGCRAWQDGRSEMRREHRGFWRTNLDWRQPIPPAATPEAGKP